MKHLWTAHLQAGERLEVYQAEDADFHVRLKNAKFTAILTGKYALNFVQHEKVVIIWSADGLVFFDGNDASKIEERDFVGRIHILHNFHLVGDNHIITRSSSDFSEVFTYFHNEIITDSWLEAGDTLMFSDASGSNHRVSLSDGSVNAVS